MSEPASSEFSPSIGLLQVFSVNNKKKEKEEEKKEKLVVVIGEFWTTLHPVTPAGHPGPASSPRPNPN